MTAGVFPSRILAYGDGEVRASAPALLANGGAVEATDEGQSESDDSRRDVRR